MLVPGHPGHLKLLLHVNEQASTETSLRHELVQTGFDSSSMSWLTYRLLLESCFICSQRLLRCLGHRRQQLNLLEGDDEHGTLCCKPLVDVLVCPVLPDLCGRTRGQLTSLPAAGLIDDSKKGASQQNAERTQT